MTHYRVDKISTTRHPKTEDIVWGAYISKMVQTSGVVCRYLIVDSCVYFINE